MRVTTMILKMMMPIYASIVIVVCFVTITNCAAITSTQLNFVSATVLPEPTVKTVPNILRYVVHNVNVYIRKMEDTYHAGCRSLEDGIRKSTRSLEDIIGPASTRVNGSDVIEPLPRPETDKIQTAINTLVGFVWSMKSQENVFVADIRGIKNSVLDFARNTLDKFVANKMNLETAQTTARAMQDYTRKTARGLEDRIKTNTRSLEDNVQKFARTIEDVNQIISGLSKGVDWREPRDVQLKKIKSILTGLLTEYDSSMDKYTQKLQMNVLSLEDHIESGLRMLVNKLDPLRNK